MSNLNLEEQVERIELAMGINLDIYTTPDESILLEKLNILKDLDILDNFTISRWLAKYDSSKKHDSDIKKSVAHKVFTTLFKPKKHHRTKFLWLNVQLGLSIMDVYNKKIHGITTSFFDEYKFSKGLDASVPKGEGYFELLDLGHYEFDHPFPDYLDVKKHFEKALKLVNEDENWNCKSELIKMINNYISRSESRYQKWLENYNQMRDQLQKQFPFNDKLTWNKYNEIYKNLKSLEFNIYNQNYSDLKGWISGAQLSAIQDYSLKFIRTLKKTKSQKFNNIISKSYVISSNIKKKKLYYLKKAIEFDKSNLEVYYKLARYYEERKDEKKAVENWIKLSECYFANTQQKKFKKDKKGLLKILGHPYMFNFLLVKRDKKDLFKEFLVTKLIYERLQRKDLTSKPLCYFKDEEGYSYITFRESQTKIGKSDMARTLNETINYIHNLKTKDKLFSQITWASKEEIISNFKIGCLKKVINNLIYIRNHKDIFNEHISDYDYDMKLRRKLNKLSPINVESLYKNCSFILEHLNQQPQNMSHCDFHLDNTLQMDGEFCTLDYGNLACASDLFDITYLLEQEALNLIEKEKNELCSYFLKKSKLQVQDKINSYDYHALYINLLGAGTFNGEKQQRYLDRANEIMEKMSFYLQEKELKQLNNLKKGLYKL